MSKVLKIIKITATRGWEKSLFVEKYALDNKFKKYILALSINSKNIFLLYQYIFIFSQPPVAVIFLFEALHMV
jgi:hypothetical protein